MLKVMTIVGTRPELIKMSRVIAEFDKHVNHVLVHTGQNYDYELNQVFFEDLEIRKPDHFLGVDGKSPAQNIAQIISRSEEVMISEQPEAILLYGDTNSCLSVMSAKRLKIPVFHMEAGNRCFDQRVPEELNRKVLDHLSDINMVLTEHARRYLIAEGIRPETIIKTGSHMDEVLDYYKPMIENSEILSELSLTTNEFFLVSTHREENIDSKENFEDLLGTLEEISKNYSLPIIVSTHPRTQKLLDKMKYKGNKLIKFMKPFGFMDYMKLQLSALCIISDSGTITEESSLLQLPSITIRNAHERPEGMDEGTLIMSGLEKGRVIEAIDTVIKQNTEKDFVLSQIKDYQSKVVSKKILRIVLSYTDYINRTVWHK